MRSEGVGPSRPLRTTWPSTMRVYRSATSTQSLSSVLTRATCPYEGRAGAGPRGAADRAGIEPACLAELVTLDSNQDISRSRAGRVYQFPQ